MKILLYGLLIGSLLVPAQVIAQKNAPIAGDAALLVDLLKKDYSSINPDDKDDILVKDRASVTGIFKSYLTDVQTLELANTLSSNTADSVSQKLEDYNKAKVMAGTLNGKEVKDPATLTRMQDALNAQVSRRKDYYDARYEQDNRILQAIADKLRNDQNSYLAQEIDRFVKKYKTVQQDRADAFSSINHTSQLQKSIPFIGGDELFKLTIDGLSRFIAKRIKEELTTSVISSFHNWLDKNDSDKVIQTLLPGTTRYLLQFKPEKISTFPNDIRQYIENDLNQLLSHIGDLRRLSYFNNLIRQNPDIDFAFEALELIPDLTKIKYPIDYFKIFDRSPNLARWKEDDASGFRNKVANMLQLSSLIAHSLQVMDNGEPRLAGADFLWNYAQDMDFYLLYTGFLHQQNSKYYKIRFNTISLEDKLAAVVKDMRPEQINRHKQETEQMLTRISRHAEKVWTAGLEIRKAKKTGGNVGADTIYNFAGSMIDLSEEIWTNSREFMTALDGAAAATLPDTALTNRYFRVARSANDIFFDLHAHRFSAGLSKAMSLLPEFMKAGSDRYQPIMALANDSKVITLFRFVNDMANAKDAEEVEKAIEALALPAGSYAIKRQALTNVSLNTYPGILLTMEKTQGNSQLHFAPSLTVPLGLSITTSSGKQSLGVFISVLDIGAITRLRFDEGDSTTALPEINFKNLFAPGVFFHFGFGKTPVSLHAGLQYGPELRTTDPAQPDKHKYYESFRFGLGVVIDIPLLNIYNKPHIQ